HKSREIDQTGILYFSFDAPNTANHGLAAIDLFNQILEGTPRKTRRLNAVKGGRTSSLLHVAEDRTTDVEQAAALFFKKGCDKVSGVIGIGALACDQQAN